MALQDELAGTFRLVSLETRRVDLSGAHAVFNAPTQVIDGVEAVTYITWQKVAAT